MNIHPDYSSQTFGCKLNTISVIESATGKLLKNGNDNERLKLIKDVLELKERDLETLKENLHRLHFEAENIVCADAIDYLQNYQGEKFDSIVIDAPCSATGIFRRHPEILLYKTKEDKKKQALLQKQILAQIGNALKTQGTLVYCVCSLSKAEGIVQIRNFLSHNHQFKLIPLTAEEIGATQCPELSLAINKEGCLQTLSYMLPSYGGIDSFFIAKLQKVE